MRFHKFHYPKAGKGQAAEVWIDLDAVVSVRRGGLADTESEITAGNWTHLVAMPLEDVLALISPPAAPDTFEEELATESLWDHVKPVPAGDNVTPINPDVIGYVDDVKAFAATLDRLKAARNSPPEAMSVTDRRARLDEIERICAEAKQSRFDAATGYARPNWLEDHLARRRIELEA